MILRGRIAHTGGSRTAPFHLMELAMRVIRLALLSLWALTVPVAAQQKAPRRPELPGVADTNSALAYYRYGLATLDADPRKASEALY